MKSEAQDQEMMEAFVASYMSKAKYKVKYKDKKSELKRWREISSKRKQKREK